MTTGASLARDVMRWRHFVTQERPLLVQTTLSSLGARERRILLARVRRLARREEERRRLARHRRLCGGDARRALGALARRLESVA